MISLAGALGAYRNCDLKLNYALFFGISGILGVILSRRIFLPMVPAQISFASLVISKDSLLLISIALLMLFTSVSMLKSLAQKNKTLPRLTTQIQSQCEYFGASRSLGVE